MSVRRAVGRSALTDQRTRVEKEKKPEEPEELAVIAFLARPLILVPLVVLVSLAIYANSLGHDFTFDDFAAVLRTGLTASSC
jgi:hypothetical protein